MGPNEHTCRPCMPTQAESMHTRTSPAQADRQTNLAEAPFQRRAGSVRAADHLTPEPLKAVPPLRPEILTDNGRRPIF